MRYVVALLCVSASAKRLQSDLEKFSGLPIGTFVALNDPVPGPTNTEMGIPYTTNEQEEINAMGNGGMWPIPDLQVHEGFGGRYSEDTNYSPIVPETASHLVPGYPHPGELPGPAFEIPETAKDWHLPYEKYLTDDYKH